MSQMVAGDPLRAGPSCSGWSRRICASGALARTAVMIFMICLNSALAVSTPCCSCGASQGRPHGQRTSRNGLGPNGLACRPLAHVVVDGTVIKAVGRQSGISANASRMVSLTEAPSRQASRTAANCLSISTPVATCPAYHTLAQVSGPVPVRRVTAERPTAAAPVPHLGVGGLPHFCVSRAPCPYCPQRIQAWWKVQDAPLWQAPVLYQ